MTSFTSTSNRRNIALLLITLGATAGLGACSSTPNDYSYQAAAEIRKDVTPELDGLNRRRVDMDNDFAMTADTNGRAFNDDLDRAFFLDRPSHLTRYPHTR
ncbi:MAG: hypothetical protein IT436_01430 [Phycisphaerales bacterium]|nr:hypothetical protein [Phycisphaerales bacterium]